MAEKRPPIPSLIIGLGGTGAVTLLHIKQQLLNIYANTLPSTVGLLSLDTSLTPTAQFGQVGEERHEGMGFGSVSLADSEFGHIGGNARNFIEDVVEHAEEKSHISRWLQAQWYLDNLPEMLFQFNAGAGQYRQLGRLALFKDVTTDNSELYRRIQSKIRSVKNSARNADALAVFLVASFVGGTGAGMVLDTAYLVRKIAATESMEVILRGYFFLPEAFSATLPTHEREKSKPRAFAALRELSRFMLHGSDTKENPGYPINYRSMSAIAGDIWRSKLETQLFDLVYLIDGYRKNGSLRKYSLAKGVSASVADAVLAFIDHEAGNYQSNYRVNIGNQIATRRNQQGRIAYTGAVGTYSIIMPIQQVISNWSFRLGRDLLDTLLKPTAMDTSSNIPRSIASDGNQESDDTPVRAVYNLMATTTPIIDPEDQKRQYSPTPLWATLHKWSVPENRDGFAEKMISYGAREWQDALRPTSSDPTRDARRALDAFNEIVKETIVGSVKTSMQQENDPQNDHGRIIDDVDRLVVGQLGIKQSNGIRDGGRFGAALNELAAIQMNRWQNGLSLWISIQLNGQDPRQNVKRARSAKIGWTIAVMEELKLMLTKVYELLHGVRHSQKGRKDHRAQIQAQLQAMEKTMIAKASRTRKLPVPGAKSDADRAQDEYLRAADRSLDMERADIAREIVTRLVVDMRNFVDTVMEQLQLWTGILAYDYESLYGRFHRGSQQVIGELDDAETYPSRLLLRDEVWEEDRYQFYKESANALASALGGIRWQATVEQNATRQPIFNLNLTLQDTPLRKDKRGDWASSNFNTLFKFCSSIFNEARNRESILQYLSEYKFKDNPAGLAQLLNEGSGVLVEYDEQTANASNSIYLLAHEHDVPAASRQFLRDVMEQLRQSRGLVGSDETLAKQQNSDDRFRLTLVSMAELLPMPALSVYGSPSSNGYMRAYLAENLQDRKLAHIFPAEVRAVEYEHRLVQSLRQQTRLLDDRVTVLLENTNRFKTFLRLMAHRVIFEDRDEEDPNNPQYVWYLVARSSNQIANGNAEDLWWLTRPASNPDLLEALTTFIFREEDYGYKKYQENHVFHIDYERVERYLTEIRQADADARIEDGTLGAFTDAFDTQFDLHEQLDRLRNGDEQEALHFQVVARSVSDYDVLREFYEYVEQTLFAQAPDQLHYDLYSIFKVLLQEMLADNSKEVIRLLSQD